LAQKEISPFGVFALVSYVPAPLGSFLDELGKSLPGEDYPQSHITLVPPRPLQVSLDVASEFTQTTLDGFSPFNVVLGNVNCFPETKVLYLDLVRGHDEVHVLHDALTTGVLAHEEPFEFRPHLTIGGPVPANDLCTLQARVSEIWLAQDRAREFQVTEAVALWFDPSGKAAPAWNRVWTRRLGDEPDSLGNGAAANDQT
jgi:hypothetical protein